MSVCSLNVHVFCTWGKGSQGQLSPGPHHCWFLGHGRGRETLLSPGLNEPLYLEGQHCYWHPNRSKWPCAAGGTTNSSLCYSADVGWLFHAGQCYPEQTLSTLDSMGPFQFGICCDPLSQFCLFRDAWDLCPPATHWVNGIIFPPPSSIS